MTRFRSITRREFAVPVLAALLRGRAPVPAAQDAPGGGQAEWRQNYDGATNLKVGRSLTPVLSPLTLQATEQMIETIAPRRAGRLAAMPSVTSAPGPEGPERRGPAPQARRLRRSRRRRPAPRRCSTPTSKAGVKRFQERHGLIPTGVVNHVTITAMNVPADVRLRQLETNIVRLRTYSGNLGNRFVVANIPAALVETVENGQVMTRHAAGVGKIDRQSPVMTTRATDINFNPFWTVPASIIRKDLIPKMQADPNYLTENKIRIFSPQGQEVARSR